jgi:NAD(P)H-hydrate epimerase
LIVDALFGTGLARPLDGLPATVVAAINAAGRPVVAVDLPSGLSADTAEIPGAAVCATLTVTFAAPKLPHVLLPGESLCGRLVVADIGIPAAVIEGLDGRYVEWLTAASLRPLIKPRKADSQKGDFGRVLIVAGSRGKTGAAALSARAALRAGAGLVTVATPASSQPIVAALGAEYMTEPIDEDDDGTIAASAIDRVLQIDADVIAAGPGLGRSPGAIAFVQALIRRARVPLVLDADALFALAADLTVLDAPDRADIVITPHPGEMSRLTGKPIADVQARRMGISVEFAAAHGLTVVLKGHRTVIALPNGRLALNSTGNPGMATAGSGDVLTGVIAGWYGQLRDVDQAVRLSVYLHGLAGDHAEAAAGESALVAGDLIDHLGEAVRTLTGTPIRRPFAP